MSDSVRTAALNLVVESAAFASEHDGVDILILSCRDADGLGTIELSRDRKEAPYDRALGLVGCCVCVDASATA
ncbi:MAG: hypothetical protein H6720_10830 [Sandaracinus sp.]|nr:hypothetical protein [Sandaracinus sp.]